MPRATVAPVVLPDAASGRACACVVPEGVSAACVWGSCCGHPASTTALSPRSLRPPVQPGCCHTGGGLPCTHRSNSTPQLNDVSCQPGSPGRPQSAGLKSNTTHLPDVAGASRVLQHNRRRVHSDQLPRCMRVASWHAVQPRHVSCCQHPHSPASLARVAAEHCLHAAQESKRGVPHQWVLPLLASVQRFLCATKLEFHAPSSLRPCHERPLP